MVKACGQDEAITRMKLDKCSMGTWRLGLAQTMDFFQTAVYAEHISAAIVQNLLR
jgi:hypothetical protein